MKKIIAAAVLVLLCQFGISQEKNFIDQPYLEVVGSADTSIEPDEIYLRIHLSEKDTRDRVSIEELETTLAQALRELGLNPEKDLSTSAIASNFKSQLLKSKDVIKSKTYLLKVGDAVTAMKVLIRLEELNISNARVDRVRHSRMEIISDALRLKAVLDAKAKAAQIAGAINQSIGHAIHISDQKNVSHPFTGYANEVVVTGYGITRRQATPEKIEFEKIRLSSVLYVKFILKPAAP